MPQTSEFGTDLDRERRRWRALLVAGIVLCCGPAVGFLGTIVGMVYSLDRIERLKAPTPGDLSTGVQLSLVATVLGFAALLVGAPLIWWSYANLKRLRGDPDPGPWK